MDQFVCVRLVKANGLDLTKFQFDYDLTFAVLFMNADGTIYGRYGSRSERDAEKDISLDGLADTLRSVLAIHKGYPNNRDQLTGKQGIKTEYPTPDEYPSLRGKYGQELDYDGQVVRSCMHCHQVRDAQRQVFRDAGKPIPDKLLFPYPMPDVIGIKIDPKTRATIAAVVAESAAAKAGLAPQDEITSFNGQPVISMADVQWVLEQTPDVAQLPMEVRRDGETRQLELKLPAGWRRDSDIKWRVTTWPLRRMGTGGLVMEKLSSSERQRRGIADDQMALLVTHVGQYNAHAAAKRAGFRKGDIVVEFDGQTNLDTEAKLLAYAAQQTRPGQRVPVSVLRQGSRKTMQLPMQK